MSVPYPSDGDVSQGHLGCLEMEKVHKLDRPALPKATIVHSLRLVIQLDLDWQDFDVFYRQGPIWSVADDVKHLEKLPT
jgi:hypothetical protein